jgi:hypothetical protein
MTPRERAPARQGCQSTPARRARASENAAPSAVPHRRRATEHRLGAHAANGRETPRPWYHRPVARELSAVALALALGGCTFDSYGGGSASQAIPGDDDGTEGEGSAATADGGDTTAGNDGVTSAATTLPPADETADGATGEGSTGHPNVTISHGPVYDFGLVDLGTDVENVFTVANEGDGEATALQLTQLGGAFSIVSDGCGDVLEPQASCDVRVRFGPELFGDLQSELAVAFLDQGMAASATRQLVGRGVGITRNLLVNGGGEAGNAADTPPMGWQIVTGPSWSANWPLAPPVEGSRTISAGWGPPELDQFTLHQQVHVAPLTTWGDAAGVRFYFRAYHRAESDLNDPTWVVLRLRNAGGSDVGMTQSPPFSGTSWNLSEGNLLAPADTHYLQFALECNRDYNNWCSGFFDDLEVWAEWLG